MSKHLFVPAAVLVLFAATTAEAQGYRPARATPNVEIEARLWGPDLSGGVQVTEGDFGTLIDLDQDLGIQDDDSIEGRLTWFVTRRSRVRFGFQNLSSAGDATLSRTVGFSGIDFNVSTRVVSDFSIDYGRVGWAWQIFSSRHDRIKIGPLLEAKAFRGEAGLEAPDLPTAASGRRAFEAAFGTAGLILDVEFAPKLHGYAETTVLVQSDEDGDLSDTEFGLRYFVTPSFTATVGSRTIKVDVTQDDDRLDLDFDGVFFGLGFRR